MNMMATVRFKEEMFIEAERSKKYKELQSIYIFGILLTLAQFSSNFLINEQYNTVILNTPPLLIGSLATPT
jgi:hypothetical protein